MFYDDYNWSTKENDDNPFIKDGTEANELNRKEGWEVLYFINNNIPWTGKQNTSDYQKVEKMIRLFVPKETHDREEIARWIVENF